MTSFEISILGTVGFDISGSLVARDK
jgi:hypothetical protein